MPEDSSGLLVPGNIDLADRPQIKNPDGSISTVRSISFRDQNGLEVLIPTVVGNRVVSNDAAIAEYRRTGKHLGIFDNENHATAFAQSLHESEARKLMPDRIVELDGVQHHFPADATDAEISSALQMTSPGAAAPPGLKTGSALAQSLLAKVPHPEVDVVKGAAEGALGTARGLAGVVLPKGWQEGLSALRQRMGIPPVSELTKPANLTQAVGKGAEQVGEFLVPESLATHVLPAANLALKVAGLAGANAGLAKLQGAGPVGTTIAGALGAAGPVVNAIGQAAAPVMAAKIETTLLKPGAADIRNGFQVQNIFKHGVGGTLDQTLTKTSAKIANLSQQLQGVLGASPATIDIADTLNEARAGVKANAARQFGQNASLSRAFDTLEQDLPLLTQKGTAVDLVEANKVKQALGDLGAWMHTPAGVRPDPDAAALEQAANTAYGVLKTRIENAAAPDAVKAINKQLSELIPIRSAVIRRIPVEARQEVLRLGDVLGLISGHIPVSLAARLFHSGQVANLLSRAPNVLPAAQVAAAAGAKIDAPTGQVAPAGGP